MKYLSQVEIKEKICVPCAVGRDAELLKFSSGIQTSSRVSEDGDSVIPVISIDEAFPDADPDYVKMDIEGSEADALSGMVRMLKRTRPMLAVSAYHKPGDLFELPLLLAELLETLHYRFHLRCHCANQFDTVIYAVPERFVENGII